MDELQWKISGRHPNDLYQQAERLYTAGDFPRAIGTCKAALQRNPLHAPSRALLTELQFIQAQDLVEPASQHSRPLVLHQQLLIEIDNAFERGERDILLDEIDQASREYQRVLQLTDLMPTGVEVERRAEKARRRLSSLEN